MSETQEKLPNVSLKKDEGKYWIKTGAEVMHRDHGARKMYVDKLVKQTKIIRVGTEDVSRVFIIGVDCHWINSVGEYGSGRFLTMELLPWKDKE